MSALANGFVTRSGAHWAFGPVALTNCSLIYSRASRCANAAPALSVGQADVMAGCSAVCTTRHRLIEVLHGAILPPEAAYQTVSFESWRIEAEQKRAVYRRSGRTSAHGA